MKRLFTIIAILVLLGWAVGCALAAVSGRFYADIDGQDCFRVERQVYGFRVYSWEGTCDQPTINMMGSHAQDSVEAWASAWIGNHPIAAKGIAISTAVLYPKGDPYHCHLVNDSALFVDRLVEWMEGHWNMDPKPAYENVLLGGDLVPIGH